MSKLVGLIVAAVLDWLYNKAASIFRKKKEADETNKAIEDENRKAREQTDRAESPKEREESAKNIIGRF